MDRSVEYIEFTMEAATLRSFPAVPLPNGYAIRPFRTGDERHWSVIEHLAGEFSTPELGLEQFEREFGPHPDLLATRMFLLDQERDGPVGTATAWLGKLDGRMMGRVHWVAIVPEQQGRGLARPLIATVMNRLGEEHEAAYLTTQTWSWRAVKLYREFGFTEVMDGPNTERAIAIVNARIEESRRERVPGITQTHRGG